MTSIDLLYFPLQAKREARSGDLDSATRKIKIVRTISICALVIGVAAWTYVFMSKKKIL